MRSKLALILAALVLPLRGEGQERQGGAWQLTTSRSAAPDQPSVTLELDALNVVRAAVVTFCPALYLLFINDKIDECLVRCERVVMIFDVHSYMNVL